MTVWWRTEEEMIGLTIYRVFGKDTKQVDYAEVCQNTQDLD